ncbi:hypothetical protein JEQ05_12515 [Serratia liquefaciens]|uniref:hypothetical protein n=1 Tax=Serratia liquefaciens TaxID=614 RepID=UPI0018E4C247|nr:hypothetical protein [Serratia liquefaciens]MBI6162450.1 hypothetical protein [Serratia liquefaciens]
MSCLIADVRPHFNGLATTESHITSFSLGEVVRGSVSSVAFSEVCDFHDFPIREIRSSLDSGEILVPCDFANEDEMDAWLMGLEL